MPRSLNSRRRDKTRVINLGEEKARLDFLGYTFCWYRDRYGRGHRYLYVGPSKKALQRERDKLTAMTDSHQCHKPIPKLIEGLNRQLKGWGNYFKYATVQPVWEPEPALRPVGRRKRPMPLTLRGKDGMRRKVVGRTPGPRGTPPSRSRNNDISLLQSTSRPTRASAAVQGDRPTIYAGGAVKVKVSGIGRKRLPHSRH